MEINTCTKKKCTRCIELKDKDLFINKCGMCKPCRSIHRKEYRENNIESYKEKDRKYYEKNKDKKNAKSAEYYIKNKEQIMMQRKFKALNINMKAKLKPYQNLVTAA